MSTSNTFYCAFLPESLVFSAPSIGVTNQLEKTVKKERRLIKSKLNFKLTARLFN